MLLLPLSLPSLLAKTEEDGVDRPIPRITALFPSIPHGRANSRFQKTFLHKSLLSKDVHKHNNVGMFCMPDTCLALRLASGRTPKASLGGGRKAGTREIGPTPTLQGIQKALLLPPPLGSKHLHSCQCGRCQIFSGATNGVWSSQKGASSLVNESSLLACFCDHHLVKSHPLFDPPHSLSLSLLFSVHVSMPSALGLFLAPKVAPHSSSPSACTYAVGVTLCIVPVSPRERRRGITGRRRKEGSRID